MKNLILIFTIFLVAGTKLYAQPYLNITNNTPCKIYIDFNCADAGGSVITGTGGTIFPVSLSQTYDARIMNGGVPVPAGYNWRYGRVGDDPSKCAYIPAGGGCQDNAVNVIMSDGVIFPYNDNDCYNVDTVLPCNTCTNGTINVKATFYPNGNCDIDFS